ncbi:hypothetical protein CB1_000417009 [Camelus ferus]|nr:hypothetical protein CB1_000417009 [Camelus ferus]
MPGQASVHTAICLVCSGLTLQDALPTHGLWAGASSAVSKVTWTQSQRRETPEVHGKAVKRLHLTFQNGTPSTLHFQQLYALINRTLERCGTCGNGEAMRSAAWRDPACSGKSWAHLPALADPALPTHHSPEVLRMLEVGQAHPRPPAPLADGGLSAHWRHEPKAAEPPESARTPRQPLRKALLPRAPGPAVVTGPSWGLFALGPA